MNDVFAGHLTLPVCEFPAAEPAPGAGAVAWRLHLNSYVEEDCLAYDEYLDLFLESVDTARVRELVFGVWGEPDAESTRVVGWLAANAGRFPALRAIALGDIGQEEAEMSWIEQSDVTPLLAAFPALEVLEVRGGMGLDLAPVRHAALRVLRVESAGLAGEFVRAVGESDLPALEHLEVWLGATVHEGDVAVADLAGILAGERLPALRGLGLRNSDAQDEVAAAVATAPVAARLEALSLGMGTLTDEGAEALLSGQPLTHLKRLDLHHHYLTEPMCDRLRAALPGVEVDLGGGRVPRTYDWAEGELFFSVAVAE